MKTDEEMSNKFEELKQKRFELKEKASNDFWADEYYETLKMIREISLQMDTITWCRS